MTRAELRLELVRLLDLDGRRLREGLLALLRRLDGAEDGDGQ